MIGKFTNISSSLVFTTEEVGDRALFEECYNSYTVKTYKSKIGSVAGTSHGEVIKNARREYKRIQALTKRQPYVRSKYFGGEKVFINIFFNHLVQKRKGEQMVRAKLFLAAVDLLRNTAIAPDTLFSEKDKNTLLHRFYGETKDKIEFAVQVKQNKRTSRKDFMSVFPNKKRQ